MKKSSALTSILAAGTLLVLVSSQSVSHAQQNHGYERSLGQMYRSGYDANVQWPKHFIPPARRSVHATYEAMINNGWRRQNLLGNYHFEKNNEELTSAGKLKVNWILSQAPVQHRNIFVQRGKAELQTTTRLAAVNNFAVSMSPVGKQIRVSDTHIVAEGVRATSVDRVFVGYAENRMPPVLPASSGSGSEN